MFSENCPICNEKLILGQKSKLTMYFNKIDFICINYDINHNFNHKYKITYQYLKDYLIDTVWYSYNFGNLSIEKNLKNSSYTVYIWNIDHIQSYDVNTTQAIKLLSNPENAIKKLALLS